MKTLDNNYTKNYSSKTYNAGIYLRLSREDEDNNSQSQSITNQKDFLTAYAIENGYNIIDYYIDDGYSGTNFDRPAFNKMIEDIEKGKINMVITKDLSRLGRDYITTGHYLEKYFPSKNVRYIAVNDNIDTHIETNNDMTPFKAVMNDMYAKDISKKVRTAITTKKLKGEFIGTVAPYGYKKDSVNKNKLVIDEETARIVQRIFSMFIQSQSALGIAKDLTSEGIPTPSEYKKLTRTQARFKGVWNDVIIRRILTNPTYIGNLTQNRSQKINYKIDKQRLIPKEKWITINNTHEPIISEEDFNIVQRLLTKKNYIKRDSSKSISEHLLSGLIFCGDCGSPITFMTHKKSIKYAVCATWKKYGRLKLCTAHRMREEYLNTQIISILKDMAQQHINQKELLDTNAGKDIKITERLKKEGSDIRKQLDEIKSMILSLYKDKVKNIISEEDFIEMSKEFHNQRDIFAKRLDNILKAGTATKNIANDNSFIEKHLKEFLSFKNVDRAALVNLIDKMEIYEDKKIIIKFNFAEL